MRPCRGSSLVLTYSRRRSVALVVCGVLGVLIGVLAVLPPQRDRAVFTVARLGATVRLKPRVWVLILPLARRVRATRADGAAVVEAPLELRLPAGATLTAAVRLHLEGHGTVPSTPPPCAASAGPRRGARGSAPWTSPGKRRPRSSRRPPVADHLPRRSTTTAAGLRAAPGRRRGALRLARVEVAPAGNRRRDPRHGEAGVATARPRGVAWCCSGSTPSTGSWPTSLIRRGVMPNLGMLVARGAHAVLEVPKPLISPVGCDDDRHRCAAGAARGARLPRDRSGRRSASGVERLAQGPALWELSRRPADSKLGHRLVGDVPGTGATGRHVYSTA